MSASPPPPFANENLDPEGDGLFAGEMSASPPPPFANENLDPDGEGLRLGMDDDDGDGADAEFERAASTWLCFAGVAGAEGPSAVNSSSSSNRRLNRLRGKAASPAFMGRLLPLFPPPLPDDATGAAATSSVQTAAIGAPQALPAPSSLLHVAFSPLPPFESNVRTSSPSRVKGTTSTCSPASTSMASASAGDSSIRQLVVPSCCCCCWRLHSTDR